MEWTQSDGCPIHKCAREHHVQFCGLCKEFPCEWLVQKVVWRPNVVEELTELANLYYDKAGFVEIAGENGQVLLKNKGIMTEQTER